ncbi:MAG: fucose isomerase [Deltaproteobacteria bacterium]|nr:fucose isomerase [Candidatus Zymogenaceae bacterium]
MKYPVTIGVVCLARTTFDYTAARGIYERIQADLERIENAQVYAIPDLVIEVEDARKAAAELRKHGINGLVVISGTFHLGHLALELDREFGVPILLWGLNELPYDGGKIRLNSVCGVNLNASNLYKSGHRGYHVTIGDAIDENWVDAVRVVAALRRSRVGIAGYRAHGFFNLDVADLSIYREIGTLVDHFELADIYGREVKAAEKNRRKKELKHTFDTSGITDEQLERVASLSAQLDAFMESNKLDALALRCWPEFAREFGIAPCAAMSLLQSEGRIIACEGDLEGTLSMLAHSAAGGETPFLFDFSQVNIAENFALLWHCGVAPCSLWDGVCTRSLDTYFAGGRGVTADFVLREGDVSILRIDTAGDEHRLFLARARGIPMEKELKGTYLKVTFPEPVERVLNRIIYTGIAHHASMVYGDFIAPFEIVARIYGWRVIA